MSLVKNADLLDLAKLGRAAILIDLMTYAPATSSRACSSVTTRKTFAVNISGEISTRFMPSENRRAE